MSETMCLFMSDREVDGEPHRLCGDGHGFGESGGRGDPHHAEHHLPLRLQGGLRAQPAVHGPNLRSRFRLLQKHLPGGQCDLHHFSSWSFVFRPT